MQTNKIHINVICLNFKDVMEFHDKLGIQSQYISVSLDDVASMRTS